MIIRLKDRTHIYNFSRSGACSQSVMVINRNARKELYFDTQRGVLTKFVVKAN